MENTNNTSDTTDTTNIIPDIKKPIVFYPMILILIVLIISLYCIVRNVKVNKSTFASSDANKTTGDIILATIFCIIIVIVCITLLPNFKEFKQLFSQIHNVTYMIIYTVGLILFFTITSNKILDKYYYIVAPLTALIGIVVFSLSAKMNYVEVFNINYERIKSVILFFCVLTSMIVYYSIDPGGLVDKYFGYLLLLTIIISVFAFLYLIIILTLPDTDDAKQHAKGALGKFSTFAAYGSISFVIFLIAITIIIKTYPGGFFNPDNKARCGAILIITLLICIFWSMLLVGNTFPEISDKKMNVDNLDLFKRALLMLFGLVISILIIVWIVYALQIKTGQSGTISIMVNILLVLVLLSLIYKTIYVKKPDGHKKGSPLTELIMNIIFYIPCIFTNIFDSIMKMGDSKYNAKEDSYWYMLVLAIMLFVIYFSYPILYNKLSLQGGKLLVNRPVSTNAKNTLGTYQDLNGNDTYDYNFALSFWIFLDAFPPNTNPSYTKYISLLNYGEKPNVRYNPSKNTLLITMHQKDLQKNTENKLIEFDEHGNRILFKKENMLLQKWDNIILNYTGGILDIFLNGELVKSDIGVVHYYTLDSLTVGEDNGFEGGICSVVYYDKSLSSNNVYYIYTMLHDKKIPITKEENTTIITYDK
jgi:hypothetical protein